MESIVTGPDPIATVPDPIANPDWRSQLPADGRQRIVNLMTETLKRHMPEPNAFNDLNKIVMQFEEEIYSAATSQADYMKKISLKKLSIETKAKGPQINPAANPNLQSQTHMNLGLGGMQSQSSTKPFQFSAMPVINQQQQMGKTAGVSGGTQVQNNQLNPLQQQQNQINPFQQNQLKLLQQQQNQLNLFKQNQLNSLQQQQNQLNPLQQQNILLNPLQQVPNNLLNPLQQVPNNLLNPLQPVQNNLLNPLRPVQNNMLNPLQQLQNILLNPLLQMQQNQLKMQQNQLNLLQLQQKNQMPMPFGTTLGNMQVQNNQLNPLQQNQLHQAQTSNPSELEVEEMFQKVKSMKENYLMGLIEVYQNVSMKLNQSDPNLYIKAIENIKKMNDFKIELVRYFNLLEMNKDSLKSTPNTKERLQSYEKRIISILQFYNKLTLPQQQSPPQQKEIVNVLGSNKKVSPPQEQEGIENNLKFEVQRLENKIKEMEKRENNRSAVLFVMLVVIVVMVGIKVLGVDYVLEL